MYSPDVQFNKKDNRYSVKPCLATKKLNAGYIQGFHYTLPWYEESDKSNIYG